ncbi:MAG TPA: D-alanyl-D-alanine carboxypeptidase family protein [Gammaproteobacteria bacterium]|nr:D-alanyl-D-alanine carboxypeptidase family protein [Gammaproteobacteria bacterium]
MRHIPVHPRQRLAGLLLACLFLLPAALPALAGPVPSPPEVAGKAAFLMDFHSGRVLANEDADKPWPPASLTKMMTLYTTFKALDDGSVSMDDTIRVSKKAWQTHGSRMFLEVGDEVPLKRIVKGVIVESGNDACVALAEHVAGSTQAFVQLMNSHARELGLEHTHFANPTGLPAEGMKTTARDMAHLAAALLREYPDHYDLFSIRKMSYNDISQYNRNRLMWWDDSVDGLKTGHTERAGYHLVASAERDGMRLISVVLGTDSERARAEQSQSLLNYGFRFYRTYKLYEAGEALHKVRVWKGARDHAPVSLKRDLYVTIPRGQRDQVKVTLDFREPLMAPVAEGQEVGKLTAKLGDKTLAVRPLTALNRIPEGGIFRRMIDSVRVWLTE